MEKALASLGHLTTISRDREVLLSADQVILPGVGSFGDAMSKIREFGLDEILHELVDKNTPLLGICLGLQLLFERSEESPEVDGLGILKGEVVKIPLKPELKIPHTGWNSLEFLHKGRLFKDIPSGAYVYYVHSYYVKAADMSLVSATTKYSETIHAAVEKDMVFGCQFHPEKSSDVGLRMLNNFGNIYAH